MTKMPVKILRDENNDAFVPFISLDAIEKTEGESVGQALDKKLETHNIKAGNQITIDVDGNDITINNDASGMNIINNLETEEPGLGSLDAHQGKILKDSIPEIVNNLNTIDSTKALSAHQGYVLAGRSVPVGGASGQVLKKTNDNDYALEWGDAADPNAIGGDGTIKKIVELSYQDYLDLKDNGQLDETTEYHINDWTESGLIEVKAEQVIMSDGYDVEEVIRDDQGHIVNLSNRMDTVEYKLENKDIVDEGQNTRLDVAEGNIDTIVGTVNTLSTGLSKTLKMVYSGSSGGSNAYKDTGLSIEGGYGGGAYLVVMTWHLSSGDPTGTTIDIISLPYSGTNFKQYRICELRNNDSYSKHLYYQASANNTLEFSVGGSGDAHIHIYKL